MANCVEGAASGLCSSDPSFLASCPLSCNQCKCGDNSDECQTMASQGRCVDNPSYMLVHCAASCNQCGDNCGDNPPYSNECRMRAARGDCKSNEDMMLHCAASCKFCGDHDGEDEDNNDGGDTTDEEGNDGGEDDVSPW